MSGLEGFALGAAPLAGGALLGGMAGMRYHRKVDRVGFGEDSVTR